MLRQTSIVYFLGYKLLFLVYSGWWLIYYHLDIAALILWIVYGSFIVVLFIFSFLWLDSQHPRRHLNQAFLSTSALTFIILGFFCLFFTLDITTTNNFHFCVHWINYYELLNWHNSEEIECLGWELTLNQPLLLLLVATLLSCACILAVLLIVYTKKIKWILILKCLRIIQINKHVLNTAIRRQHFYQQEKIGLLRLNKILKGYHRRRT